MLRYINNSNRYFKNKDITESTIKDFLDQSVQKNEVKLNNVLEKVKSDVLDPLEKKAAYKNSAETILEF